MEKDEVKRASALLSLSEFFSGIPVRAVIKVEHLPFCTLAMQYQLPKNRKVKVWGMNRKVQCPECKVTVSTPNVKQDYIGTEYWEIQF